MPHLKCIKLVFVRSRHLPFKMHSVVFRAFKSPFYEHGRANRNDLKINLIDVIMSGTNLFPDICKISYRSSLLFGILKYQIYGILLNTTQEK